MTVGDRSLSILLAAGALALLAGDAHGAEPAAPTTIGEVRAMLDMLGPDDLKAESDRLDTVMTTLFPGMGEDQPCNDPGRWVSSTSLCEWHAPSTPRDGLPDAFVSVSRTGVDSVLLWGSAPLNAKTWVCEIDEGRRQAIVCVLRAFQDDRRKTLFREWRVTLAEITRPGDDSSEAAGRLK